MRVANLYNRYGRFDKAEPYWRELLAIQEKKYGPENSMLGSTLYQFAQTLVNLGRLDQAEQMRQRMQTLWAKEK